ncbi:MAG: class I SAM-dependent methyltransferase [Desulfovibrio sp.]|nr:class I SAM-dependent methyltransferase [Desulfovibrio sp.]
MKTFLHVGCGSATKAQTTPVFRSDEWKEIRLDVDPLAHPDIVSSITNMEAVADASVDAVYSSHNIEHLYAHDVPKAIREFLRVLKDDGYLVITCPDLKAVCAFVVEEKLLEPCYVSPAGPVAPFDMLYGYRPHVAQGRENMAHKSGFTEKVLTWTLRHYGFSMVASMHRGGPHFDIFALATKKPMPDKEIRQLALQHFPKVK